MDTTLFARLSDAVKKHNVKMVVIDTYSAVAPTPPRGLNAYERDAIAGAKLHRFAHEHGLALVLIHHTKKGGSDDVFDSISGSRGIPSKCDHIMVMERAQGSSIGTMVAKSRVSRQMQWALGYDLEKGIWSYKGDDEWINRTHQRQQILDALKSHEGEWLTVTELCEVLKSQGISKTTAGIRMLCRRLVEAGFVEEQGGGRGRGNQKSYRATELAHTACPDDMVEFETIDGSAVTQISTAGEFVETHSSEGNWLTDPDI
jgi:Fe2+ or Zn2+ uptake regulation protein